MRIFWQSFVDASVNAPYMARLSEYLNNIAASGTTVHVEGITPPDREFGRLAELRCAVQAIDNGIAAEEGGFDAFVMGHFQDPGLYELRSTLEEEVRIEEQKDQRAKMEAEQNSAIDAAKTGSPVIESTPESSESVSRANSSKPT